MRLLHGDYDGGGPTAVAMAGDCVVSAGRDGDARLWRIVDEKLQPAGRLRTDSTLVSSIAIGADADDGVVWLGSLDGCVRRFEGAWGGDPEAQEDASTPTCTHKLQCANPVLCMALHAESGVLGAGTADGGVELFRTADSTACGLWRPLAFDGSKGYKGAGTRAIAIASVGARTCVVAGGTDGNLHLRPLATPAAAAESGSGAGAEEESVFDAREAGHPLLPAHGGSCVALAPLQPSQASSLLISGAHDGTLRVWDLAAASDKADATCCLFGLGGYKVWLGSVWTDGQRLVSDGRDNAVVLHDFSQAPPPPSTAA